MVVVCGIIAFLAATYGLYAQIHKKEKAQAYTAYIVMVLNIIIAVFPFINGVDISEKESDNEKQTTSILINTPEATNEKDREVSKSENTKEPKPTKIAKVGNIEINGTMAGKNRRIEQYMATQTGEYRFDFDIDDETKEYFFCICNSKNKPIKSGYSADAGISAYLEGGMQYTLVVEHYEEDETVDYSILIHSPDRIETVQGDLIEGEISYINQEKEYTYTAVQTGKYRFDFDIDDETKEYDFYLFDSKNKQLLYKEYLDEGGTQELIKGNTYKIKVVQKSGFPKYKIKIGIPKEIKAITGDIIEGKIEYTDQNDVYTYIAPRTGKYRFDFDIDNVDNEYDFKISNNKGREIATTCYSNDGQTVELEKGEKYEIQVGQNTGVASYSVQIHVPNKIFNVTNDVISGNMTFIDQQDVYYYIAKKTGTYCFTFDTNNVDNNYKISVYSSKHESMFETYSDNEYKEVTLKRSQKYKIYVTYSQGFEKYKILIKYI